MTPRPVSQRRLPGFRCRIKGTSKHLFVPVSTRFYGHRDDTPGASFWIGQVPFRAVTTNVWSEPDGLHSWLEPLAPIPASWFVDLNAEEAAC